MGERSYIEAMALLPTTVSHFLAFFSLRVMNEDILDVMLGWRRLLSANK
jgi:hypothetical protein